MHAIDIDAAAVKNTLANAFRNGVADRVTAAAQDLYPWVPEERYDLIVASLYQLPVDPFEQVVTHRPLDYWGRNLLDHLIRLLPEALADDGTAYIMQMSIIGEKRTAQLLDHLGYQSRVVDFAFFEFSELFRDKQEQITRVEASSDAYHLKLGDSETMIAYLLEVTRKKCTAGPFRSRPLTWGAAEVGVDVVRMVVPPRRTRCSMRKTAIRSLTLVVALLALAPAAGAYYSGRPSPGIRSPATRGSSTSSAGHGGSRCVPSRAWPPRCVRLPTTRWARPSGCGIRTRRSG